DRLLRADADGREVDAVDDASAVDEGQAAASTPSTPLIPSSQIISTGASGLSLLRQHFCSELSLIFLPSCAFGQPVCEGGRDRGRGFPNFPSSEGVLNWW